MSDRSLLVFGDCELDLRAWRLLRSGRQVLVEPKSLELLALLLERAGEVVGKNEILDGIWKDVAVTENAMVRVVAQLRNALGDDAKEPRYIETVHTRGYRFVAPVTRRPAPLEDAPGPPPAALAGVASARRGATPPAFRYVFGAAAVLAVAAALTVVVVWSRAARRSQAPSAAGSAPTPSIAVLPLENLGPSEQQFFADGMTEAITAQLAKIEALKVIARGAVLQYRPQRPSPSQIARELGVAHLVEGSALLVADRVRITVRLVDGASDRQIWAESYEGDLTDVLALQSRVARAIAREVRARLTADEETRVAATRMVSPPAYTAYLKGLSQVERTVAAEADMMPSIRGAIESFSAAVALEPGWGEAHGQLAEAYRMLSGVSDNHTERLRGFELSRQSAERALGLDPAVASAHLALARVLYAVDGDWEGAEREFREAVRLQPNSGDWSYGRFLMYARRFDEAHAQLLHAQERWPTTPWLPYDIGYLRLCEGRLDEAHAQVRELRGTLNGSVHATLLEAMVLSRGGRYAEAADLLERHRQPLSVNRASTFLHELAYAAAKAGQPERARRAIRDLEAVGGRVDPSTLFALGDLSEVRRVIEERYRVRDYALRQARCWPEYDSLMRIPEVARILREAGPPEAR
jgi:TolB-like protein/DNA-binding winged helix-turn-helix (wHTH) protein/Tfp pilus assembly protein PilF